MLTGFRRCDLQAHPVVSTLEYPRVVLRHPLDLPVDRMPDEAEPMPCNGHPMTGLAYPQAADPGTPENTNRCIKSMHSSILVFR